MEHEAIGRQLRARRTAAGRTVASVAADAGLSVPYVANLENGRGNPTATALTRPLAGALGTRLLITLEPGEGSQQAGGPPPPEVPASLVRLGRTARSAGRYGYGHGAGHGRRSSSPAPACRRPGRAGARDGPMRRAGLVAPPGRSPACRRPPCRAVGGGTRWTGAPPGCENSDHASTPRRPRPVLPGRDRRRPARAVERGVRRVPAGDAGAHAAVPGRWRAAGAEQQQRRVAAAGRVPAGCVARRPGTPRPGGRLARPGSAESFPCRRSSRSAEANGCPGH